MLICTVLGTIDFFIQSGDGFITCNQLIRFFHDIPHVELVAKMSADDPAAVHEENQFIAMCRIGCVNHCGTILKIESFFTGGNRIVIVGHPVVICQQRSVNDGLFINSAHIPNTVEAHIQLIPAYILITIQPNLSNQSFRLLFRIFQRDAGK